MSNIKNFNNFINENYKSIDKLTLYHGTCLPNAQNIIDNGWKPLSSSYGSNMGNSNYLYLSSDKEDALWFAEEKGCNTIIMVSDIPIEYLKPDPEDEIGYTTEELLDRMYNTQIPSKFALTKPLDKEHFKIIQ